MRHGYDILARRFRTRHGELDVVAFEREILVFVEVKTRASREFGDPWEYVDWQKQQRLRQAADEFIARFALGLYAFRFDVVSVVAPGTRREEITLFQNAF